LAGGLNLFQYASNPLGWVDPFGLVPTTFKVDGVTNTLCIKNKFPAGSAEAKEMTKVLEQQESTKSKSKEEVLKRLRKNARRG
jgi:uncharacterized protein RhaS with RHS repeats